MAHEDVFPTRLLRLESADLPDAEPPADANRVNQHIEPPSSRAMTDDAVARLLNDPFATLVLRQGVFPASLSEVLFALDTREGSEGGLPQKSSFVISEGGQVPFQAELNKGGGRLIVVRGRNSSPELLISILAAPGISPRAERLLIEVISWPGTQNRREHPGEASMPRRGATRADRRAAGPDHRTSRRLPALSRITHRRSPKTQLPQGET